MSDMIKVRTFTSKETQNYKEEKYKLFLKYYFETDLPIREIYKILGLPAKNSAVKYIRNKMKQNGYNSNHRYNQIIKGEWL